MFVTRLGEQGFNLDSITPYLELTYREYDKSDDTIVARFEVQYPGLTPICQYARFDGNGITTSDEWFISLGGGDKIFNFDKKESSASFYYAFRHISTTYVLKQHLEIVEPWQVEE